MNDFDTPLYYLKILLIDDEIKFHVRFMKTIEKYGHDVEATIDPKEGIKKVEQSYADRNPFDVVFIDYLMPNLNGVEVAQALKKIDPDLILIALTRDGTMETKILIVKSMAFDLFFLKNSTRMKISKILACLESTKLQQYSGKESGLSKKLKADQQKKKSRKAQ